MCVKFGDIRGHPAEKVCHEWFNWPTGKQEGEFHVKVGVDLNNLGADKHSLLIQYRFPRYSSSCRSYALSTLVDCSSSMTKKARNLQIIASLARTIWQRQHLVNWKSSNFLTQSTWSTPNWLCRAQCRSCLCRQRRWPSTTAMWVSILIKLSPDIQFLFSLPSPVTNQTLINNIMLLGNNFFFSLFPLTFPAGQFPALGPAALCGSRAGNSPAGKVAGNNEKKLFPRSIIL